MMIKSEKVELAIYKYVDHPKETLIKLPIIRAGIYKECW
jgi:hypothetical protein